jgi:hypothetical protein
MLSPSETDLAIVGVGRGVSALTGSGLPAWVDFAGVLPGSVLQAASNKDPIKYRIFLMVNMSTS